MADIPSPTCDRCRLGELSIAPHAPGCPNDPDYEPPSSPGTSRLRKMETRLSNSFVYDPERVQKLYDFLRPDPVMYGDDPVEALWRYLNESALFYDVFEEQGDCDTWIESDEEYDPDA